MWGCVGTRQSQTRVNKPLTLVYVIGNILRGPKHGLIYFNEFVKLTEEAGADVT